MTLVVLVVVFGAGAKPATISAQPRNAQRRAWIDQNCGDRVSPVVKEALTSTTVVDVHTHTFNLAYLPVKGILVRFRLPTPAAHAIAEILVRATDVGDFSDSSMEEAGEQEAFSELASRLSSRDLEILAKYEGSIRKAVERSREENEGVLPEPQDRRLEETGVAILHRGEEASGSPTAEAGRRSLALVLELLGGATHAAEAAEVRRAAVQANREERATDIRQEIAGFLGMAALLTRREDRIARQLISEFPLSDVFVHHLMDLDKVYNGHARLSLQRQIQRAQELRDPARGLRAKLAFSVAFDPFRGEEAFANVRAGVAAGAVAVKFYPPSGYKPSDTVIPAKPSLFQDRFPFLYLPLSARNAQRRQWSARYGMGSEPISDRIARFVRLVGPRDANLPLEQQGLDVPVFSHHTPVGFEAMPGYGRLMARPVEWRKVLDQAPKTRLVLAHSGGGDHWFHEADWEGSFDQQAYELCTTFENVYCDFGMSTEILSSEGRSAFRRRLESLIPQCAEDTSECNAPRYDIRDKILYGSDWHMLARDPQRRDLICSFAEAFSSPLLQDKAAAFFGLNALKAMPGLANVMRR